MCPRLVGYFWRVYGTKVGERTYFCTIAKTEQDAIEIAKNRGYKNPTAELWSTKKEEQCKKPTKEASVSDGQTVSQVEGTSNCGSMPIPPMRLLETTAKDIGTVLKKQEA